MAILKTGEFLTRAAQWSFVVYQYTSMASVTLVKKEKYLGMSSNTRLSYTSSSQVWVVLGRQDPLWSSPIQREVIIIKRYWIQISCLCAVLKNQDNHLEVFSPTANDTIWDLDIALELLDHLCQKLNFSAMNHSSVGRISSKFFSSNFFKVLIIIDGIKFIVGRSFSVDRSVTFLDSVRNLSLDVSATRMDKTLAPSNRDCQS